MFVDFDNDKCLLTNELLVVIARSYVSLFFCSKRFTNSWHTIQLQAVIALGCLRSVDNDVDDLSNIG